jgi:fatty-acyl-CoA synthase
MSERAGSNYVVRALDLFAAYGDQEAVVYGDRRLTYSDIRKITLGLAGALREEGVGPGSGVAMLVPDESETPALQLALHLLGCRTVWIATYAPPRDQAAFIRLAVVDTLIYHPGMMPPEQFLAGLAGQDAPLRALCLGPGGQHRDLLAGLEAHAAPADPDPGGAEPESLFYSGGTTGTPKLVRHGQGFYQVLLAIAAYYLAAGEPPMRFLSGSSFSHVSGQMPAFLTLFEGGTLFLGQNSSPAEFLATIERERISSTFLTPALLQAVTADPLASVTDTSSMRYLNVGGAAAAPARLAEAIECFGPVLRLVYGSSEAPLITDLPFLRQDPEHPERLRSCGLPFADTRIEIRDSQGRAQPAGQTGEVWVAGSLIMAGYWMQPELTSAAMDGQWLRTGDVGYLDADGYLYLVDRVSDMIVTSIAAANVYARPIEDVLASHPQVRAAAVIGVPDEAVGEALHAFVVPVAGADVSATELRTLVRTQLNNLYTPGGIDFVDHLPLTPLAKVDKKLLRERYQAKG